MTQPPQNEQFLLLFLQHEPRLYAFIRSLVFNDADADELLQETAADLWRKFGDFAPGSRFDAWALTFARHKVLNYQRQRCREGKVVFSEQMIERLADQAVAAAREVDETLEAMRRCMDKLPESDRDLIHRRYRPGATNRSVAHEVGKSESVISRSLNRIYAALLQCIRRSLEGEAVGGGI